MKKIICIKMALCLLALSGITGCSGTTAQNTDTQFLLNTFITLTADCSDEELDAAFELCREYEAKFSRTDENSEVARINRFGETKISKETRELIERSLYYSELSGGKFDITICPVSELWDFNNQVIPSRDEIAEALKNVDYQSIYLSYDNTVKTNGSTVDLGGIAKGYIADRLLEFFEEKGAVEGIINLGGNVLVFGDRDYTVAIKKPFSENETSATLKVKNKSVVTSGIYERYIEKDGVIYHHILDPETGYPAATDLLSATVICDSSVDADALATICILSGSRQARELIENTEGAQAVFINSDGKLFYTSGLKREDGYIILK